MATAKELAEEIAHGVDEKIATGLRGEREFTAKALIGASKALGAAIKAVNDSVGSLLPLFKRSDARLAALEAREGEQAERQMALDARVERIERDLKALTANPRR